MNAQIMSVSRVNAENFCQTRDIKQAITRRREIIDRSHPTVLSVMTNEAATVDIEMTKIVDRDHHSINDGKATSIDRCQEKSCDFPIDYSSVSSLKNEYSKRSVKLSLPKRWR